MNIELFLCIIFTVLFCSAACNMQTVPADRLPSNVVFLPKGSNNC